MKSLRAIFTPYERKKPWTIWLTPGLITAVAIQGFWFIGLRAIRTHINPLNRPVNPTEPIDISPLGVTLHILSALLSAAIVCPLSVIVIRLSIQRNHPAGEIVAQDDSEFIVYSDEDVVRRRNEEDPYTGLGDCVRRIVTEEGRGTLFRAWWLTLLGQLL